MKYVSKEIAIEQTKTFFSKTDDDKVSLRDAFLAWGRDLEDDVKNRAWFSNKMTQLKYHNLVKPLYVMRNNRRVLDKIQLTLEGKKLLDRMNNVAITPTVFGTPSNPFTPDAPNGHAKPLDHYDAEREMSIPEVMRVVAKLRRNHPEFDITFDIKLRDSAESSGTD
jgi:hypothetical protein